jgi:hypothetical protein
MTPHNRFMLYVLGSALCGTVAISICLESPAMLFGLLLGWVSLSIALRPYIAEQFLIQSRQANAQSSDPPPHPPTGAPQ